MKRTLLRIFLLMILASTFVVIFKFSSQDGTKSSSVSRKVAQKIIDIFPYTRNLSQDTKTKIVEKSQPIIRKLAHFSIYTVVGICIMGFISTYDVILLKKFLVSLVVGLIYAISDEYHQSFVPGREASIRDVCIDTAGVFMGIIIVLIIISVFKALSEGIGKNKKLNNNI